MNFDFWGSVREIIQTRGVYIIRCVNVVSISKDMKMVRGKKEGFSCLCLPSIIAAVFACL